MKQDYRKNKNAGPSRDRMLKMSDDVLWGIHPVYWKLLKHVDSIEIVSHRINDVKEEENIIIYTSKDGKATVSLFAQDGQVWMTQNQLAELFATSKQNVGQHITSILSDKELYENSVVKKHFTTAADGKEYFGELQ